MTRFMIAGAAAVALAASVGTAAAQNKTFTQEKRTISATVEAIDHATRQVTVKKQDGTYEMFYVPASVKRFESLKIGNRVTATHYENIVLQVQPPGSAVKDKSVRDVATPGEKGLSGTLAHQRTITATITAIDQAMPSITFSGPQGFKYSTRVEDKAALAKVKVGDKVDITWTEAVLVTIDDVK